MQTKAVLGLDEANRILDAAQAEAESNDWPVVVALVDDGGHPLALRRLNGAAPLGSYVATEKARTAALGRKATRVFEDMINAGRTAFLSVPNVSGTMTGGVPVWVDDQIVGAVGVSGVTPDQDAQIADAGLAAL